MRGREEKRLVAALQDVGLPAVHHQVVEHEQWPGGRYILDVGLEPLAVEVHTSSGAPWQPEGLYERSLWLLTHGWALAYLWLRDGAEFTAEAVDTLADCYHRVRDRPWPMYVVYGASGERLHTGELVLQVRRADPEWWPREGPQKAMWDPASALRRVPRSYSNPTGEPPEEPVDRPAGRRWGPMKPVPIGPRD